MQRIRLLSNMASAIILAAAMGVSVESLAVGDPPALRLEPFVEGFNRSLAFVQDPSNPLVQYVCEQRGRIHSIVDGVVMDDLFLDLTEVVSRAGASGLLGIAFPPDYATDGRCYLYYNLNDRNSETADPIQIVRYQRDPQNPLRALPDSAEVLIEITRLVNGHAGGHLAFGPDGMLYAGIGDGRLPPDPDTGPQDPKSMFGKFLRIDVSPQIGYDIPSDNPFLDGDPINALPEIWSFGWRNPWRWSFDDPRLGGTGAMVIADVGRDEWEEVDYEPPAVGGRNYGWPNLEGAHPHGNFPPPPYGPLTDPIFEYDHTPGQSVTGGFIYRGRVLGEAFRGRYFYGDFVSQRIWSLGLAIDEDDEATVIDVIEHTDELGGSAAIGAVASFGVDMCGELYIVSLIPGAVQRIVAERSPVAEIQNISMQTGMLLGGEPRDLRCDDDFKIHTRSGFGQTLVDLHNMEIIVSAETTIDSPTVLDLTIESRIDEPSGLAQIRLRNWNTNQFESVGSYSLGNTDQVETINNIGATDYIDGSGNIDLSIKHLVFVPFLAFTFESFIDQVEIVVY